MKKKIPYFFIILGLLVIAYPFASNLYSSYWENRMLEEAEALLGSSQNNDEEDLSQTVAYHFAQMNRALEEEEESEEALNSDEREEADPLEEPPSPLENTAINEGPSDNEVNYTERGAVIGKIQIPSIDVNLPLLFGSDAQTLDRGAGQIIGTAAPGEIGNTAIAGHRANRDGRFFYRLNELKEGDEIIVETRDGTFVYRVYDTKIVDPTDLSVLNRNQTDKIVTLITCHPRYTADYRLIVHGVLTEDDSL